MYLRRHNHTHLWNNFNLTCSPQCTKWFEQLHTTGLLLFPDSTWIWFLLPEHHNLLNSAIQCRHIHLPPAIQHLWMTATCRHFIWILTLSPLPQADSGGAENNPLLSLSPPPFPPHINAHVLIHTLNTFYLPSLLPPS